MGQNGLNLGGFGAAGGGADALERVLARARMEQLDAERRETDERDFQFRVSDQEMRRQQQARADADALALRTEREAQTRRINAGLDKSEKRATDLEALTADPTAFDKLTPLQRILALSGLGVANVGIHDVENPGEHSAHQQGERDGKFSEWQRQYDYQNQHPRPSRATADPVARVVGRLRMDDPSFPRGVQSYVAQLRSKYPDFNGAQSEFSRALESLQQAHPSLSPMKALNALRQQYGGGGNPGGDDALLDELLSEDAGTSGARPGGGPRPGASGGGPLRLQGRLMTPGGAPAPKPDATKTVSTQELQLLAQKRGTSVEQEKQRAAAAGYIVR